MVLKHKAHMTKKQKMAMEITVASKDGPHFFKNFSFSKVTTVVQTCIFQGLQLAGFFTS